MILLSIKIIELVLFEIFFNFQFTVSAKIVLIKNNCVPKHES